MVIFACATIIIAIWACALMTLKHVQRLTEAPIPSERFSLVLFVARNPIHLQKPKLSDSDGRLFFFMITSGIYDTLNVFINTYFWELRPRRSSGLVPSLYP